MSRTDELRNKLDRVRAALRNNPDATVREIQDETGICRGTVHNLLLRLIEAGELEHPEGRHREWKLTG